MKILLVTPMPPRADAPGAIPLVLDALLSGLRHRHEVTLVTTTGDEPGERSAVEALRHSGLEVVAVDRRQPEGLARHRRRLRLAATWSRGRYPWRTVWFAEPAVQDAIDRLTKAARFDVVAVEDNSMGVFHLPGDVPTVLTEHEVRPPPEVERQAAPAQPWVRRSLRAVDRHRWPGYQRSVWQRFDRIQVFTPRDAALAAQLAPEIAERLRVNPFGIALPGEDGAEREQPGTMLFAGNFMHPPNLDAAVWLAREIVPRVRSLHSDARLKIVGAAATGQIRSLEGEGVEFIGEVRTMADVLGSAAVVLAPVRQGGGMRMKVLHALASGKAVVTTERGAEGLLFQGPTRPLVVADDPDVIARETARLLTDRDERRRLGNHARAFVREHHSPAAYAARLESVYSEAIEAHAKAIAQCGT